MEAIYVQNAIETDTEGIDKMSDFEFVSAKVIDSCVEELVGWMLTAADHYTDGDVIDFEKLCRIIRQIPSNIETPKSPWTY